MGTIIHPSAIIEAGAQLAKNVTIGPYCHVSANASLADNVTLKAHIVVAGHTQIGADTKIFPFAVLGEAPQHTGYDGEATQLIIGERNIIREHVTMHAGTVSGGGKTVVGNANMFMAGSHVAHDCKVADNIIVANSVLLGGHVMVEDHVFIGGGAAVHQFCQIGAHSFLGGCAAVIHDVIPFGSANGNYARLEGLNIIGMKRRGFSRDAIDDVRAAYTMLFQNQDGAFQDRLAQVEEAYIGNSHVGKILEFVRRKRKRPTMMTS